MGDAKGKKLSIIYVADILRQYSDCGHPLSQKAICDLLASEYSMTVERRSVTRSLLLLEEAGFPVECTSRERQQGKKKGTIHLHWYWRHALTKEETKALIDLLYFSSLPAAQVKTMAEKLKRGQSIYFDDNKAFVRNIPAVDGPLPAEETEETIRLISEAIARRRKVSFYYDHYEADGKRHHAEFPAGTSRVYQVSPYMFLAAGGRYCLVANLEGSEETTLYQAELIASPKVLDEAARPQKTVRGLETGLRPAYHVAEYSYLQAGAPEMCTFRASARMITRVVEDFGKSATFLSADPTGAVVEVCMAREALAAWSLQYAPHIRILSPPSLVKTVKDTALSLARLYGGSLS